MNRKLCWPKVDWAQTDQEIAAVLGCTVTTVRKKRKALESPEGGKKGVFARTAPQLTLRLEEELYSALEFLGVLAGGFKEPVYISEVIRALLIHDVGLLKETFPEGREALMRFLRSRTAEEAEKIFEWASWRSKELKNERSGAESEMEWGMDLDDRLRAIGMDRRHRAAYRKLTRIKGASNLKSYVFRLQAAPAKGYGRVGVAVYVPARKWEERCELAFEAEGEQGKPLALGVDIAEAEKDLLRGLPKEASPREIFDGLFGNSEVMAALRPRIEDQRIREKDCDEKAFWNFCRSKGAGR